MKKVIVLACVLVLMASVAFGQTWSPTPMVVTVNDQFQYAFNGSNVEIPFNLTGKPGTFWLVINTKLAAGQKPVAVMNGFKGWHFVNGIDTTIYVSSGRDYQVGNNLKYPWDGKGNEKNLDVVMSTGNVAPGTYSYYIVGYDNKSDREIANSFIPIGHFMEPQFDKFYVNDDKGAPYPKPMLMGTYWNPNSLSTKLTSQFSWFKFQMGDDPYDESKIETCFVAGFNTGDVQSGERQLQGVGLFDPNNHDIFYFVKHKYWENSSTVVKYTYVPGGEAVQDASWGDYTNGVKWWWVANKKTASEVSNLLGDEDYLYMNDCGHNPVMFQCDLIRAFPWDDPSDVQFDTYLNEFWAPNSVADSGNVIRLSGEANRFDKSNVEGRYYMAGDVTCLVDLVDVHKMLAGATEPFASDGSGYVTWANSNGDFFSDKQALPEPVSPQTLWQCHTYEPRNYNNLRNSGGAGDQNGFLVNWLEFAGLFSADIMSQDGSGVGFIRFADDSFSAGGDNTQKKGNGYLLDAETQFDGLYMLRPMKSEPAWGDDTYLATCWVGMDSDGGTISNIVGVEDAEPVAFSVAQNTPNPFNPTTAINFTLARDGQVSVDVFNIAGQKVATLANDVMTAGNHSVNWDANGFAAGVYFYTVKSGDYSKTMKMTLLK